MSDPVVNYLLRPFKGKINIGYSKGINPYIKSTKKIDKGANKLDTSVSNDKQIITHFLSQCKNLAKKCLVFMVETGAGPKKIFMQVDTIQIEYIHHQ